MEATSGIAGETSIEQGEEGREVPTKQLTVRIPMPLFDEAEALRPEGTDRNPFLTSVIAAGLEAMSQKGEPPTELAEPRLVDVQMATENFITRSAALALVEQCIDLKVQQTGDRIDTRDLIGRGDTVKGLRTLVREMLGGPNSA